MNFMVVQWVDSTAPIISVENCINPDTELRKVHDGVRRDGVVPTQEYKPALRLR